MIRPFSSLLVLTLLVPIACSTAPKTDAGRESLKYDVKSALAAMKGDDPSLEGFLDSAYGYAIFPSIGKGGLIVGGAYGKGEVYERGRLIGFADVTQATVGLQAGGQSFSQVIAFENKAALDRFLSDRYQLSATASAVALKSGAGAAAKYTDGIAIFVYVKGGLMAEAAVGGQQFSFSPARVSDRP
jgi:lipid-binding SYLF domain-containing protein